MFPLTRLPYGQAGSRGAKIVIMMYSRMPDPVPDGSTRAGRGALQVGRAGPTDRYGSSAGASASGPAETLTAHPGASEGSRLVTVLCVDDQAHFRGVLRGLVAETPGFIQVGEARSGEEAITAAAELRPDLVLMDVRMPGIDGCQTAATLLRGDRRPFIVLMSAEPFEPPSGLAARAGEVVFVPKGELGPHRLLDLWQGRRTS